MLDLVIWAIYFFSLYIAIFWLLVLFEKILGERKPEELEDRPFLSIIVPAYNEEGMIGSCIESLINLDYPKEKIELIVVNDGSKDRTSEICRSFGKRIKFVDLEKNSGNKAVPLNVGLKMAKGELVACMDADSIVDKKALSRMIPYFNDERVAAVTPALKVYNPGNIVQKLQWFEYLFSIFLRKAMSMIDCIYVTPGPFSLFRKEVVVRLGGFDENNITEDMEIALRLQSNDYVIKNAIDAYVYTLAPGNMRSLFKQRNRWYQGLMYNSMLYRKMIFNRMYGDFGMFMGLNVIGVFVLVASASLLLYYTIEPVIDGFAKMFLVDFDILTYLLAFSINFQPLDFDFSKIFILVIICLFGFLGLLISSYFSNERLRRYGVGSVVVFTMFYFVLLGLFWVGALANMARGARKTW